MTKPIQRMTVRVIITMRKCQTELKLQFFLINFLINKIAGIFYYYFHYTIIIYYVSKLLVIKNNEISEYILFKFFILTCQFALDMVQKLCQIDLPIQ